MILERHVCHDRGADGPLMPERDWDTHRGLDVEVPPTLASGQGRRDHPGIACKRGDPAWRLQPEERGDDVVAGLLVRTQQALLDRDEWGVAPSGRGPDVVALHIEWRIDQKLVGGGRNQLKPLAVGIRVDVRTVPEVLPILVVSDFLLQSGRDGHERCHPMRLAGLRLGHAIEPVREVVSDIGRDAMGGWRGGVAIGRAGRRLRIIRPSSAGHYGCGRNGEHRGDEGGDERAHRDRNSNSAARSVIYDGK